MPTTRKLTREQAYEARRLRVAGWTQRRLVARYGLHKLAIQRMLEGVTYKDVPMANGKIDPEARIGPTGRQWAILLMRTAGMSFGKIAAALGVNSGTVYNQYAFAQRNHAHMCRTYGIEAAAP